MATIKDIATKAKVSITTVSRVLNQDKNFSVSDQTRSKIFKIAEELNYITPTNRPKKKDNKAKINIGLVYWYTTNEELNDPYYFSIRMGIENECSKKNINLENIYLANDNFDSLTNLNLDSIIVLGKYSQAIIEKIYSLCPHLVMVDHCSKHYHIDVVIPDLTSATNDIIEYYFNKNLKHIGLICGVEQTSDGEEISDLRLTAYRNEMVRRNVFDANHIYLGQFTADSGYDIMSQIIKNDELLDCYIVASDSMAIGCLKALSENNIRVPEVVSLISYDNTPLSQFTIPSLSSVNTNTKLMAEAAVTLLLERIETGRDVAKKVIIPTQIIFRDSCI